MKAIKIGFTGLIFILSISKSGLAYNQYTPRLHGTGSINKKVFGFADFMTPFFRTNSFLGYFDFVAQVSDKKGAFVSPGIGGRYLLENSYIFGAYLFLDRNRIKKSNYYSNFTPGIELLSSEWDYHLNFYIPQKKSTLKNSGDFTKFSFHQQYLGKTTKLYNFAKGANVIIGKRILKLNNTRIYGSGYHYRYKNLKNINGVELGFEIPLLKNLSLVFKDSYDNKYFNEINVGISINFGDIPEYHKKETKDRLKDPVRRFAGNLKYGTSSPIQTKNSRYIDSLVRDNIWFFDPNGNYIYNSSAGLNNCTFENPCSGSSFNQANVDSINNLAPNPNFYINTGTINFTGSPITLPQGSNVFGRMNNFYYAASNSKPMLYGTFILNGNNVLDSFSISGSKETISGFGTQSWALVSPTSASGNITINNLNVSSSSSDSTSYSAEFRSSSNLHINNSVFTTSNSSTGDHFSIGIRLSSNLRYVLIENSTINANNTGTGRAQGVVSSGAFDLYINNSTINANNENGTSGPSDNSTIGVFLSNSSNLVMNNSTVNTNQKGGIRDSSGIKLLSSSSATINNSVFNVQAQQASNTASAANLDTGTTVTFNNSTITVNNPSPGTAKLNQTLTAATLNNTAATCNGVAC